MLVQRVYIQLLEHGVLQDRELEVEQICGCLETGLDHYDVARWFLSIHIALQNRAFDLCLNVGLVCHVEAGRELLHHLDTQEIVINLEEEVR